MEQTMIQPGLCDIYDIDSINAEDVNNKLFCTFVEEKGIDDFIFAISQEYTILYNKIFVLEIKNSGEYVCTYNVDRPSVNAIP